MATACSSSSCIAGFLPYSRSFRSSGRDTGSLASGGFSQLLAMEVAGKGRAATDRRLRALIRQMSIENPLWGAPRIHGELLKLGFEVAQSTVAKYMTGAVDRGARAGGRFCAIICQRSRRWTVRRADLRLQPALWLRNRSARRRELIWIGVTSSPTAEWIARQITEAFPWDSAPDT